MALAYDFDIFEVIPNSESSDPQLDGFITHAGFRLHRDAATVALFREERTAAALRTASPDLRGYFLASGFGLNTYDSGAPRGHYPAKDEAARLELIQRLTENVRHHTLPRPDDCAEGGDVFRLGEFLAELDRSIPIDMAERPTRATDHSDRHKDGRGWAMAPVFETDPISDPQPEAEAATPRRKFWQNRFFRLGGAAVLLLGAMQLISGPSLTVLASL